MSSFKGRIEKITTSDSHINLRVSEGSMMSTVDIFFPSINVNMIHLSIHMRFSGKSARYQKQKSRLRLDSDDLQYATTGSGKFVYRNAIQN